MVTTPVRIAGGAIVLAGAAWLGLLAVRAAADSALPVGTPARASLLPRDPDGTLTLAVADTVLGRARLDPSGWAALLDAAEALPLDARPFFLGAIRSLAAGRDQEATVMLEEARRRDPRLRLSRLLLMDRLLRTGRAAEASSEMGALARLLPEARGPLTDALANLARDPKTRDPVRRALLTDPVLFNNVLAAMAAKGTPPDTVLRFAGTDAPQSRANGNWRDALVSARIEAGDPATARALWSRFYRVDPGSLVVDGDFGDTRAPAPFGWDLTPREGVGAATVVRGALDVQYYGRQAGPLARQLLLLSPGSYRLQTRIEGTEAGDGTSLGWTLTCAGASTPFATMAPLKINPAPQTLEARVVVPAGGCRAQWLALEGFAGEFAAAINARIDAVRIMAGPAA